MDPIDYYNRYAAPYFDETAELDMSGVMQPFIDELPENAEVLDLGCGSGRDTIALSENGFLVTAMDGAEEMCRLAEVHTDQDVLQMTYDEMDFDDVFDGIWACASLIHLTQQELRQIMKKLILALKQDGVLYFSVHKGERDGVYGGLYIHDYTRRRMQDFLEEFDGLKILDIWTTDDVRGGREDRRWLNVLVKKI